MALALSDFRKSIHSFASLLFEVAPALYVIGFSIQLLLISFTLSLRCLLV